MPHTSASPEFLKRHPQARADDLMHAFEDSRVNAIIASIGGLDSIRLADYLDLSVLRNNPKTFMGFSDITCVHFMCQAAGLQSYYGPSILANFAADPLSGYTIKETGDILFSQPENRTIPFDQELSCPRQVMQGEKNAKGKLTGGCIENFPALMQAGLWPDKATLAETVFFIETVPALTSVDDFKNYLRFLGKKSVYDHIQGILFGRAGDSMGIDPRFSKYNAALTRVIADEFGRPDLPVIANMEFGHTQAITILPYQAEAHMDVETAQVMLTNPSPS